MALLTNQTHLTPVEAEGCMEMLLRICIVSRAGLGLYGMCLVQVLTCANSANLKRKAGASKAEPCLSPFSRSCNLWLWWKMNAEYIPEPHTLANMEKKKSATWFPFPVHLSIWHSGVVYGLLLCSHFWHMPCNYTCCSNAMYHIFEWHPRAQDNENATRRQGLQRINSFAYCVHEQQQQQQQLRGCGKWLCTLLHYFPANVKFLAWLLLLLLRRLCFVPSVSW